MRSFGNSMPPGGCFDNREVGSFPPGLTARIRPGHLTRVWAVRQAQGAAP
jgi:hypothetical protein